MSKMDGLRAMREAKYARGVDRAAGQSTGAPKRPARPAPTPVTDSAARASRPAPADPAADADELCGHRNMGGRTCTRERGHAAKSHRYS